MRKQIAAIMLFLVMLLPMFRTFKTTETAATEYEINEAINLGMQWLATEQNTTDGSWGTVDQVGKTGFAVLKFGTHAVGIGENPLDPTYEYYDQVRNGLDYIFANASTMEISMQLAGDPDTDGDGFGVCFGSARTYETGIAMMAIATSTHPEMIVNVPGSSVDGWTYEEVLQDTVDYLAFGQTDAGNGRGGWSYEECNNTEEWSDNSNTGYAVLGLAYAEAHPPCGFGLTVPYFVKSELDIWIDYIQNDPGPLDDDGEIDPDGGSGYSDPYTWVNILKTGHLLCEMAFVGDGRTTQRVTDAIDYIIRHWDDADVDPGWKGSLAENASYQAMYTTMTGLEALGIDGIDGIDWFGEFSDVLVAQQNPDGSWPPCIWDDGEQILATEWALLTLQKTVPPLVVERLYAGGSDPGVVYQYAGGTQWNIISPTLGNAVLCLCEYEGYLYAGSVYADIVSGDQISRVWRYDGGTSWTLVGDDIGNQVFSLIVFREKLYAGAGWGSGKLYRYDGVTTWTMVVNYTRQDGDPPHSWSGFWSLYVWNDILYIGDAMWDLFGHYDGTTFTYDADLDGSCIWDYEVYDNNLYASAFVGRVHRSSDGTTWTTIRDYQDYDSWELEIFQDYLYVTTGPKLERYDGASFSLQWTEPRGAEIISMINAGNSLVLGTGTGTVGYGRIYTYDGTQIQLISGDMGSGIQALLGGLAPVDVAVTNVMPSKTVVGQGYCMNITVTVENQGGFPETFNVTAYYSNETLLPEEWETFWSLGDVNRDGYVDDIDVNLFSAAYGSTPGAPNWNPDADLNQNGHVDIDDFIILEDNIGKDIWTESNILGGSIGRQTVDNLSPVHSATLVFTWNTTGIPYGNYIISAKATRIIGETDVEDNTLVDSTAFVTIIGDVDGDGSVVASDLVDLAEAYGSEPRDANWNPNCDLNNDGKIDASDLFDLSKNYGKTI